MTSGIEHLVITVSNMKKSKKFYSKVCGLKIFFEDKEWVGLKDGEFKLWLSEPRDYRPKNNKFDRNRLGLDHLAFKVTSMKELKKIEAHLRKSKIKMEDNGITDDGFGGTAIFISDPDRMKVEFGLEEKK